MYCNAVKCNIKGLYIEIFKKNKTKKTPTYLSNKDPEEQQCDVPCKEEEACTDPQMVEQGEVQQSSYAVKRLDRAGGGDCTQTHPCNALHWSLPKH